MAKSIVNSPTTLSPLPPNLQRGLTAVSVLGFLSFLTSLALFGHLAYKLLTWRRKTPARFNQFLILIFNLILADIQQSVAFLLNAQWLRDNAVTAMTPTCWAQGWFVSTGDLASGVFTFAISLHCFLDIVWDYRLGHKTFLATILAHWAFIYGCAIIGIGLHPSDFYRRAGAWCWINGKYSYERLWLHYFWLILAEFGTVLVYTILVLILRRRIRESFYTTSDMQLRAESAARLIIAYPVVYIVCTLPLVTARLRSMAGDRVSFTELCIAGAMITSNGFLDVLLYSLTRRALLFGPATSDDKIGALNTFRLRPDQAYGTTTTIEASHLSRSASRRRMQDGRLPSHSRHGSTEELVGMHGVKAHTVVQVSSEVMEMGHLDSQGSESDLRKARGSFDVGRLEER